MSHTHFIGPWVYYTCIKAARSEPQVQPHACYWYLHVILNVFIIHTYYTRPHLDHVPPVHFTPTSPTTFPLLTYDSMMLLTSDFFPFFGTSLLFMHPSWVFPYHPIIVIIEAPKSSRVLEMGNVSGAGRKAPGLKWCCGGGRRMMPRLLGVKMYKLRYG